jgi:hypothetical protein
LKKRQEIPSFWLKTEQKCKNHPNKPQSAQIAFKICDCIVFTLFKVTAKYQRPTGLHLGDLKVQSLRNFDPEF